MNGIGYGTDSDSDSDSSITKGGVSGYNDKEGIFTTDNRQALAGQLDDVFDETRVNEELGAQVEITQAFDQERRKIKTEINAKEKELRDEAEEARDVGEYEIAVEKARAAEKLQTQGLLFDAVSGAIYGPNTNGVTGYVAKSASPFVASQIGTYFKANEVVNRIDGGDQSEQGSVAHILAQGILGAAISYATGNDALTGGVSASTGEATVPLLSKFLYGSSDPSKLTAEQKDTISALTIALGAGIGASTGNASDAANAAETSKVAVEDNYYFTDLKNINKKTKQEVEKLYNIQKSSFEGKCRSAGGDCNDVIQKMINFAENPYVKKNYGKLTNQTLAKLESNPELVITYFDSLAYKFNAKDQSILNRYIKPTLEAGGGAIGGVGSISGAAYACGAPAGIGCYAAVVAGSAGLSSSSDHLITGTNNFGKPLSEQDPTQIVQTLQGLGLSKEAAQTLQLGIDVLGTGGVGFGVGSTTKAGKFTVPRTTGSSARPSLTNQYKYKEAGEPSNLLRTTEVNGIKVRVSSGHGYNRAHNSGDVRTTGLSMDEIDNAIINDLTSNVDLSKIPTPPFRNGQKGKDIPILIQGHKITYRVVKLPNGEFSINTFFPTP